jgi:hypothetical protein
MPRPTPQLPTLSTLRSILRGETPKANAALKPTGRYYVSATTFKSLLLLSVPDQATRVAARASGELPVEYEGRTWRIVRSTAVKEGVQVEYEA